MTTDYIGATDEMNGMVLAEWDAACLAIIGAKQKLFYQGVVKEGKLEVGTASEYWGRVSYQTVDQDSIGPGAKRHCAVGNVFVQMFFPLSAVGAWRKGLQIANRVKNTLAGQSSSGTVWFRRPRINELTPEVPHHRLNVVAEFEYDEIVS